MKKTNLLINLLGKITLHKINRKTHLFLLCVFISSCGSLKYDKIRYSKTLSTIKEINDYENLITFKEKFPSEEYSDFLLPKTEINNDSIIKKVEECDIILLRSGEEILAKVIEIGIKEIKYKKCNSNQAPIISIQKNDVFMIKYANGSKDIFKIEKKENETPFKNQNTNNNANNKKDQPVKVNGLAITSLVLGLLGIIPLAGFIFGVISISQINNNPDKYTGKGLAIAGIILSIIWILLILIILL